MLTLRLFQRTVIGSNGLGSGSFRCINRTSNGRTNGIGTKIQPPTTSVFPSENLGFRCLLKPLAFTICFSSGVFVCSAIWQYEEMKKVYWKLSSWRDRQHSPTYKKGELRRELNAWWNSRTEGQKVAYCIIAINLCVYLFWRIRPLQPFMQKYFTSSPAYKSSCLPMFLSTFSHYSFLHLAANMYVLHSFSTSAVAYFGKEQFVAVYCSAGVVSSFTSYLYKVISGRYSPSLGASGALMAILSSYCLSFPDAQLALIFFPFFTISASQAIKGIMILDTVGILAKWKLFDHAAHLGGASFGILYLAYGCDYIWGNREHIVKWWHNLRKKV